MLILWSRLPRNRYEAGQVWATSSETSGYIYGPVRARGEADNTQAARHDNVIEDPAKAYGDHPEGGWLVTDVVEIPPDQWATYGPFFLRLEAVDGEAARAVANGRSGFGIHGGRLHEDGRLRETYGCLRVDDRTVLALAALVRRELTAGREVRYECRVEDEVA